MQGRVCTQESQAAALVKARIVSAKCMQETLEVAWQALARIEAATAKLPSTDVQLTVEPEEAAPDSPFGDDTFDGRSEDFKQPHPVPMRSQRCVSDFRPFTLNHNILPSWMTRFNNAAAGNLYRQPMLSCTVGTLCSTL